MELSGKPFLFQDLVFDRLKSAARTHAMLCSVKQLLLRALNE